MLTNIVVVAPPGAGWPDFEIPMFTPGPNGLFVSKVDGLTPVAKTVNTQPDASGEGEFFVGTQRGKRNIVLTIGMESRGFDVDFARNQLYGFFYTQGNLRLRFEFDNRDSVEIDGYPETHEGDRFVQDLETQISIICPKPNFIESISRTVHGGSEPNPVMVEVINGGDQSIGFLVKVTPSGPLDDFNVGQLIFHSAVPGAIPGEYFTSRELEIYAGVASDGYWTEDDDLWLDTRKGSKSVYFLNRLTGEKQNALRGMTDDSVWPILHPGLNVFSIRTPTSLATRGWDIFYQNEFAGV